MFTSILTCVRNASEAHLRQCAASVLAQDCPLEWIIVEDGSDSRCSLVLGELVSLFRQHLKVQYVRLARHSGLSVARNTALERASGDWIFVLDADDRIGADALRSVSRLASAGARIVFFDTLWFSATFAGVRSKAKFYDLTVKNHKTIHDPLLWFDFFYQGLVARRDVIRQVGGYDARFRVGEDIDILLRVLDNLDVRELRYSPTLGYEYRSNPCGVSNTSWDTVRKNYETSLLAAALRRGGDFHRCAYEGTLIVDRVEVDAYCFLDRFGRRHPYPHSGGAAL